MMVFLKSQLHRNDWCCRFTNCMLLLMIQCHCCQVSHVYTRLEGILPHKDNALNSSLLKNRHRKGVFSFQYPLLITMIRFMHKSSPPCGSTVHLSCFISTQRQKFSNMDREWVLAWLAEGVTMHDIGWQLAVLKLKCTWNFIFLCWMCEKMCVFQNGLQLFWISIYHIHELLTEDLSFNLRRTSLQNFLSVCQSIFQNYYFTNIGDCLSTHGEKKYW